ncbi:MAG: Gfo/Idh/MocA family oxidoreductase [Candidatus Omnitrophica bacterium]|nr:Gfo/Idh/MocA family oxidoreductase [Candidatus Omnitrophota bacterium]
MISVGVIGCGHWGPNHIRVFSQLANSKCTMAADLDEGRLKAVKALYPWVETTTKYQDILVSKAVDAVCIAAPTKHHFAIAKEALENGKHVLCEKPLAMTPEECAELGALAKKKGLILMVGHVFIFNAGIAWVKEYIASGAMGKVYYAHSERTNLGPFRYDVNALWDLAPHDIAIFDHLLGGGAQSASARGLKCLGNKLEDLAFATLDYPGGKMVSVHVSWADPRKVRQITIVGEKQMIVWDDLDPMGVVKVYDKHVERTTKFYETYGEFQLLSREGAITIPKISAQEPLKAQGQYFVDCVENKRHPALADADKGAAVVKALAAIQKSMDQQGTLVNIT